jgi:hypothetical protein
MPLKTGNSRRVAKSRPVCMGLKRTTAMHIKLLGTSRSGRIDCSSNTLNYTLRSLFELSFKPI